MLLSGLLEVYLLYSDTCCTNAWCVAIYSCSKDSGTLICPIKIHLILLELTPLHPLVTYSGHGNFQPGRPDSISWTVSWPTANLTTTNLPSPPNKTTRVWTSPTRATAEPESHWLPNYPKFGNVQSCSAPPALGVSPVDPVAQLPRHE